MDLALNGRKVMRNLADLSKGPGEGDDDLPDRRQNLLYFPLAGLHGAATAAIQDLLL